MISYIIVVTGNSLYSSIPNIINISYYYIIIKMSCCWTTHKVNNNYEYNFIMWTIFQSIIHIVHVHNAYCMLLGNQ